jgi:hypothetical protein
MFKIHGEGIVGAIRKSPLLFLLVLALINVARASSPWKHSQSAWGRLTADGRATLQAEQTDKPSDYAQDRPETTEGIWDPNKYISVDEVRPGMEAYCLTCYKNTEIEKFKLEVLSVIHNIDVGRDAILVQGTDERFIRTGPVSGCSGSPVYIDGRLAGALAFGWLFSKDPLYGVTPIKEMLEVGQAVTRDSGPVNQETRQQPRGSTAGFVFDFSKPIDFAEIYKQISTPPTPHLMWGNSTSDVRPLPCPLVTSGLSPRICEQLGAWVEPLGLMVVPGGSMLDTSVFTEAQSKAEASGIQHPVQLEPGAALAVPLVSGDMVMFVLGTATLVLGDAVYGFGHGFLSYGPVDLPMATGQVHTVVSSMYRSFKLGSVLEIVGALTVNESAGVVGRIGAQARMIPLTIKVDRYNDAQIRVYNCRVVSNQLLTPVVLRSAVDGAAFYLGDFPPEHMIEYKVAVAVEGGDTIAFENVSTDMGLDEMMMESLSLAAILMNNPYKKVNIESLDFEIRVVPKSIVSHIWSVDLSDSEVKAGDQIDIDVVVESFLAGKEKYQFSFKIPDGLPPGRYELIVCGSNSYRRFLKKSEPHKFTAHSLPDLIEAINHSLQIKRDKLYCLLTLPPGGVTVAKAELPDLPATKALVLQNTKRTLMTRPYQHWLEQSEDSGTVVIDEKILDVTVEE